jgi:DNA-binding response OmpR family regulator
MRTREVSSGRLSRYSVLVVEDDYLVAAEVVSALKESGATVLGPVSSAEEGGWIVEQFRPDCVLLDVNLRGGDAFGLAEQLVDRGISVVFTTGYDPDVVLSRLQTATCLRKPVDIRMLLESICRLPPGNLNS